MSRSIIIIARNEINWPDKTAKNLHTHMPDCEIIGVHDGGSNIWPRFVKVIKTTGGIGVGRSRLTGVKNTNADLVMLSDGHVYYHDGDIERAWELAAQGYIVNPSTVSMIHDNHHGCGRIHDLKTHKCHNIKAKEGDSISMIGSVYFMKRQIAEKIIAPTPAHGYNEQIMTCAAFSLGYETYALPSLAFKHLYKKTFNYTMTSGQQQRNRKLLEWWFFGGEKPSSAREQETLFYNFMQKNRVLDVEGLRNKINQMNDHLSKYRNNGIV
jgi:hypothetical protein